MTTATASAPLFTLPDTTSAREPAHRPLAPVPETRGARVHRLSYGRLTLDQLVSGAWAAVAAGAPAACPVCEGTLRRSAGSTAVADCQRCGSELA
jgi:hypothetical protein